MPPTPTDVGPLQLPLGSFAITIPAPADPEKTNPAFAIVMNAMPLAPLKIFEGMTASSIDFGSARRVSVPSADLVSFFIENIAYSNRMLM